MGVMAESGTRRKTVSAFGPGSSISKFCSALNLFKLIDMLTANYKLYLHSYHTRQLHFQPPALEGCMDRVRSKPDEPDFLHIFFMNVLKTTSRNHVNSGRRTV